MSVENDFSDDPPDFSIRLSETYPDHFRRYWEAFVQYCPKKTFHVRPDYSTGFIQRKQRNGRTLAFFPDLATETTERHLDHHWWYWWKTETVENWTPKPYERSPNWLGLHAPKFVRSTCIDVDTKKWLLGFIESIDTETGEMVKGRPIVLPPFSHFQDLQRIYTAFPNRIWCISSATLGVHSWRQLAKPTDTQEIIDQQRAILQRLDLASTEIHPMFGRCLRRPFGLDYFTITESGLLQYWTEQIDHWTNPSPTPSFPTIANTLVKFIDNQFDGLTDRSGQAGEYQETELKRVKEWLAADCPEVQTQPTTMRVNQAGLSSEKVSSKAQVRSVPRGDSHFDRLNTDVSVRNGNWPKGLEVIANQGLSGEVSLRGATPELAVWLYWVELFHLPEAIRRQRIVSALTCWVEAKHNGQSSRWTSGDRQPVIDQLNRAVDYAARQSDDKLVFCRIRQKRDNGQYRRTIWLEPILNGQSNQNLSLSYPITYMFTPKPLPQPLRKQLESIAQEAGGRRPKDGQYPLVIFAEKLFSKLMNSEGAARIGVNDLAKLFGYKSYRHPQRYIKQLQHHRLLRRGAGYTKGKQAKQLTLSAAVKEAYQQQEQTQGVA